MYTGIKFTNNASTQLSKSISASDTVLTVGDNVASIFPKLEPGDYFILTLADTNKQREVVKCTSRTDSTFTVERAQEGTVARPFAVGSLLELRLTADSITRVAEDASTVKPHASTVAAAYGQASSTVYGHVKLSDDFASGKQAFDAVACTPHGLQQAVNRLLNVSTVELITASKTWVAAEDATYTITAVGGGGPGGTGGNASEGTIVSYENQSGYEYPVKVGETVIGSGGGAGGGGAGQVITQTLRLNKGDAVAVTIGGASGTTTFGTYVTALGGSRGNNGGSSSGCGCNCGNSNDWYFSGPGGGGAGGYSYGTVATSGSSGSSGNYSYRTCYGGVGGKGAVSLEGTFGNGGNGGQGQSITNPQAGCSTQYFGSTSGTNGMQGCVKITVKLGE